MEVYIVGFLGGGAGLMGRLALVEFVMRLKTTHDKVLF
jgi:hypothetical protein